ncbi:MULTISPECIES: hypothetical protein [unclassified Micromonospora]|uniref:hypothetical protein n=1 Tax=unclassified Micromonospora TaxID=2617518 RepID=UPI001C24FBCF|nr:MULTISPECIES: hypothetical protein [unclassified Micromonospora]MBU8859778.1 hypothetical protein [Micromonospora sp. WMMB482]MDM4779297.1 hypothetical protein [Micromonospora sp. b486]
MSSDVLEKRYRMLLRAYPAGYRRERADELLDTLIGDEPTARRWPSLREAASLVRGGLRVYGGSTAPRPTAVLFWQGIHLGAVAVLALGVLIGLDDIIEALQYGGLSDPLTVLRNQGVHEVVLSAVLVALVAGRTRTAAVLAVAAAVVPTVISPYLFLNGLPQWWAPVVAAPLVVLGLRRPADVPPAPRANAVLVTAGVLALHLIPAGGLRMVDAGPRIVAAVMVIAGVAAFLWVATADQRMLIAVVPTLLLGTLHQLDNAASAGELLRRPDALPSLAVAVLMAVVAVVSTRHRQRTRA